MGHLLASVNPEAAIRLGDDTPLPPVGAIVLYQPRPGEVRSGRPQVPALVMRSDVDNARLALLVFYHSDEFVMLDAIPRQVGEDHGWVPMAGSAVPGGLAAFKAELATVIFGIHPKAETSVYDRLADLEHTVEKLTDALQRLESQSSDSEVAPSPVPIMGARRRGRPPKQTG